MLHSRSASARRVRAEGAASSKDGDELARLRARVAALERALAARGDDAQSTRKAEFQSYLYEAMLYGLARTLSLYDAGSVRVLVREMGRRIREYLEEVGYDLGSARSAEEAVEKTVAFFAEHGFVDLEIVDRDADVLHVRWHRLLALRAYARIAAAGASTFISCPLNAVLHDALAAFGKELVLREKHFDLEKQVADSWEAIVDLGPEERQLSLSAEAILKVEHAQSRELRVREEFIRLASHELSTPLTSTKMAVARLERMDLPEAASRMVSVIARQARRLEQLVAEMLDTTRLEIGRMKLDRRPVDLVDVVRGVVESFTLGEQRCAEIRIAAPESLVGVWDAARIDQVVTNLVGNAIKYGEARPIEVEVGQRDHVASLVVRDRGIGVPPEALGRIFEPFERAVPIERYGGLGLGLYITRRVVEMHGGRITVESALGEGTSFTVELPLESSRDANLIIENQIRKP